MAVGAGRKARLCRLGGSFAVTRKQTYHFKKNGTRPVTLLAVTYEGILQVTDPEASRPCCARALAGARPMALA